MNIMNMSEHARSAMLESIEQNLIELMADYLDSESLQLDANGKVVAVSVGIGSTKV